MFQLRTLAFALGLTLLTTGCLRETSDSSGIPIVGIDRFGRTHEKYLNAQDFQEEMVENLTMVNDSTLVAVQSAQTNSGAELKSVAVGLGINIRASIPQLVSLGTSGRLRLFFSKDDNTFIP